MIPGYSYEDEHLNLELMWKLIQLFLSISYGLIRQIVGNEELALNPKP